MLIVIVAAEVAIRTRII